MRKVHKTGNRRYPLWVRVTALVTLLLTPLLGSALTFPITCHGFFQKSSALDISQPTTTQAGSGTHDKAYALPSTPSDEDCVDHRDLDLNVVEPSTTSQQLPLVAAPGVMGMALAPYLPVTQLAHLGPRLRSLLPSSLYQRTSRLLI